MTVDGVFNLTSNTVIYGSNTDGLSIGPVLTVKRFSSLTAFEEFLGLDRQKRSGLRQDPDQS